mmetsp:Transcript_13550/g.26995  ORF Transcript_13550/g.26995 Transcript_13550/m.26995 type:complete len:696 (-) Transcript_13550:231-2318(-)
MGFFKELRKQGSKLNNSFDIVRKSPDNISRKSSDPPITPVASSSPTKKKGSPTNSSPDISADVSTNTADTICSSGSDCVRDGEASVASVGSNGPHSSQTETHNDQDLVTKTVEMGKPPRGKPRPVTVVTSGEGMKPPRPPSSRVGEPVGPATGTPPDLPDSFRLKREDSIGHGVPPPSLSTRNLLDGASPTTPPAVPITPGAPPPPATGGSEGRLAVDDSFTNGSTGAVRSFAANVSDAESRKLRETARFIQDGHDAASDYVRRGEYDKALAIFEDILRHHRRVYGDESHRVGSALHNIGIVLIRAADYGRALPVCRKAVRVRRAALGPDHPAVAVSMVECGIVYLALERYERALQYFRDALAIRRRSLGPDHPHVARTLNNIGCVHFEVGEMDDALCAFDEALYVQRLVLANDPNADAGLMTVAATLCNVGYIYLKRNEWDEAAEVLSEALLIQESVLGEEHKTVIATKENLATANARSENYEVALGLYRSVLEFYRMKHESVAHPACASVVHKICHIYVTTGRLKEAKSDLEGLLSHQEYLFSVDDTETRKTREMMNELSLVMRRPVMGEFVASNIINPFDVQCHQFWLLGPLEDLQDLRQQVEEYRPELAGCGLDRSMRPNMRPARRYDLDRNVTVSMGTSGDEDDLSFTSMFSRSEDEYDDDYTIDNVGSVTSMTSDLTGALSPRNRSMRC